MIFGLFEGREILWFFKVLSGTGNCRLGFWRMEGGVARVRADVVLNEEG